MNAIHSDEMRPMPQGFDLGPWWNGTGRLAPLYWGWGVAMSLALATLVALPPLMGWAGTGWAILGVPLLLAYTAWILVCVWRCADNIDSPAPLGIDRAAWSMLARLLTFGWAINAVGLSVMLLQAAMLPALMR
jgi:hypothetical protein